MFDELQLLREDSRLATLLGQYAGCRDRETWLDRVMALDGVSADALARLHGKLLAQDWIEQNTGATPLPRPGAVPQRYRATTAGQRALKKARLRSADEEGEGMPDQPGAPATGSV